VSERRLGVVDLENSGTDGGDEYGDELKEEQFLLSSLDRADICP
jgi:hypothetical protein